MKGKGVIPFWKGVKIFVKRNLHFHFVKRKRIKKTQFLFIDFQACNENPFLLRKWGEKIKTQQNHILVALCIMISCHYMILKTNLSLCSNTNTIAPF